MKKWIGHKRQLRGSELLQRCMFWTTFDFCRLFRRCSESRPPPSSRCWLEFFSTLLFCQFRRTPDIEKQLKSFNAQTHKKLSHWIGGTFYQKTLIKTSISISSPFVLIPIFQESIYKIESNNSHNILYV